MTLMVPPSAAALPVEQRLQLGALLTRGVGVPVELCFADSYDTLVAAVLSGQVTAAWAPPFASARLETAGASVVVRALRRGQGTYRAALVTAAASSASIDRLKELRAAWVDRQSVGGYLLVAAWLRERGLDPERAFKSQRFVGSYQAALRAVLDGEVDVCSCFGPPAALGDTVQTELYVPGKAARFRALAFTGEAPNDGVAVAPLTSPALRQAIEHTFLDAHADEAGRALLAGVFQAERFERAPPQGYKALYRAVRTLG